MATSSPPSSPASTAGRFRASPGRALPRQQQPAARATARGPDARVGSGLSPSLDQSDAAQASGPPFPTPRSGILSGRRYGSASSGRDQAPEPSRYTVQPCSYRLGSLE